MYALRQSAVNANISSVVTQQRGGAKATNVHPALKAGDIIDM